VLDVLLVHCDLLIRCCCSQESCL